MWELSKEKCVILLTEKDAGGNIPLHLACVEGKKEVVDEVFNIMKEKEVADIIAR